MTDDLETILKSRISKVDEDIAELGSQGDSSRKLEVLSEYKKYLEDELRHLQHEKRQET